MRIKRMRFVLPSRLRQTAGLDARAIADAAARALQGGKAADGLNTVHVQSGGKPASLLAQDVSREVLHQNPTFKRER